MHEVAQKQVGKLSQSEQQQLLVRLSQEFVAKKKEKLNCGAKFYLWLN